MNFGTRIGLQILQTLRSCSRLLNHQLQPLLPPNFQALTFNPVGVIPTLANTRQRCRRPTSSLSNTFQRCSNTLQQTPNTESPIVGEEQLWFFLWESVKLQQSSLLSPLYKQGFTTLSKIQTNGISLSNCMTIAGAGGRVQDHTFWIHSNSMKAAVQLLTDESIKITYQLYCKNDDVVTIHIRPSGDPSPNTSRASSHNASLAERKKISGRRTVSNIFIRPSLSHVNETIDALTLEPVGRLEDKEKVIIDMGMGKTETFSKEHLRGKMHKANKHHLEVCSHHLRLDFRAGTGRKGYFRHRCLRIHSESTSQGSYPHRSYMADLSSSWSMEGCSEVNSNIF